MRLFLAFGGVELDGTLGLLRKNIYVEDLLIILTILHALFWLLKINGGKFHSGNFLIFLTHSFYVKSIFRDSRSAKLAVFTHLEAPNFEFYELLHF